MTCFAPAVPSNARSSVKRMLLNNAGVCKLFVSSVKSFDLTVDPDVLLAEPLSKVAGRAPSPAADENPTSAD